MVVADKLKSGSRRAKGGMWLMPQTSEPGDYVLATGELHLILSRCCFEPWSSMVL